MDESRLLNQVIKLLNTFDKLAITDYAEMKRMEKALANDPTNEQIQDDYNRAKAQYTEDLEHTKTLMQIKWDMMK